jgi:hypothetical protein
VAEEAKVEILLAMGAAIGAAAEYTEPAAEDAAVAAAAAAAERLLATISVGEGAGTAAGVATVEGVVAAAVVVVVVGLATTVVFCGTTRGSILEMAFIAGDSATTASQVISLPLTTTLSCVLIMRGTSAAVASPSTIACNGDMRGNLLLASQDKEEVTKRNP